MNEDRNIIKTVTIDNGGTTSSSFTLLKWDSFIGVLIPDIDAGSVYMEVSFDGTNFYPILDIVDGEDIMICNTGADPGYIDISDVLKAIPPKSLVRFVCAAQSAKRTFQVSFRF